MGELQGIEEVRVFAQVPDRIRNLAVDEGDRVKAGQLLATIWGEAQTEGVNQAEAALEAALANRDAVKDNLARMRSLREGNSIAQSQLDAVESQFRAAEAQVRQATAGVGAASVQRSRTVVSAPISGIVTQVNLRAGDLAGAGVPILTIVRADLVKAVLRVPERDFLQVREGMPVRIAPLARPQDAVEGKVTVKGPVVDRMTRTGLVEVHLENKDARLVAGSAVRALIELARRPDVVLVPADALIFTIDTDRTGEAIAFVSDGAKAQRRMVRVGARQSDRLEVVEGLKPGESLVVQGSHFLRDGNPLRIADDKAEKAGGAEKAQ
jgi:RND family efflux transporter MFP subunit